MFGQVEFVRLMQPGVPVCEEVAIFRVRQPNVADTPPPVFFQLWEDVTDAVIGRKNLNGDQWRFGRDLCARFAFKDRDVRDRSREL